MGAQIICCSNFDPRAQALHAGYPQPRTEQGLKYNTYVFQLSIFILASQRSLWVVRPFAGLWKFCGVGADEEDVLVL